MKRLTVRVVETYEAYGTTSSREILTKPHVGTVGEQFRPLIFVKISGQPLKRGLDDSLVIEPSDKRSSVVASRSQ